jgi:hypothetical protein
VSEIATMMVKRWSKLLNCRRPVKHVEPNPQKNPKATTLTARSATEATGRQIGSASFRQLLGQTRQVIEACKCEGQKM